MRKKHPICGRAGCGRPRATVVHCWRHARFVAMRSFARRCGKTVPSTEELESLVPADMRCQPCGRVMNWLARDGASTVVTLQHDRSGAFRLICKGCNAKHAHFPADDFYTYTVQAGHKRCPGCGETKPLAEFWKTKNAAGVCRCKVCDYALQKAWASRNREYLNRRWVERRRARRQAAALAAANLAERVKTLPPEEGRSS